MIDVLKELYLNYYEGLLKPSAEYREACQKESDFYDALDLSEETLDKLRRIEVDLSTALSVDSFREGFRLGASLMLELMN